MKDEPSPEIHEWFDLTEEAFEAAPDAIGPDTTGKDIRDAAHDVYGAAGENTLRADPSAKTGFIHSTGHGIGFDVHELLLLSPSGEELRPGHIITIKPGLYDPEIDGIRIEDLVVVTEDGYENLTEYPVELIVE